MNTLQKTTVSTASVAARTLLDDVYPKLQQLNVIYDADGGVKSQLDDAALAAEGVYSNLTKAELDDGMYALTATLKNAITAAYTALAKIAARA